MNKSGHFKHVKSLFFSTVVAESDGIDVQWSGSSVCLFVDGAMRKRRGRNPTRLLNTCHSTPTSVHSGPFTHVHQPTLALFDVRPSTYYTVLMSVTQHRILICFRCDCSWPYEKWAGSNNAPMFSARWCTRVRFRALRFACGNVHLHQECWTARKRRKLYTTC